MLGEEGLHPQSFAEAVRIAQEIGTPYEEAEARHEWGVALAAQGRLEEARTEFEAAQAIFERLGAEPGQKRTEQALAALRQ